MRTLCFALLGMLAVAGICVALAFPPGFGLADDSSTTLAGKCGATQSALEPDEVETDAPALLGTLAFRDHTVHVYAGLRYTVEDAGGRTLAELAGHDELEELLPDFFDALRNLLADDALRAGTHAPTFGGWHGR